MVYLARSPAPSLTPFVRTLWYCRAASFHHKRERMLPTGCVQLILNLARDYLLDCSEGQPDRRSAPSLVVGARSVYEIVDTSDMTDLIGIVFRPGGFAPFMRECADRFSNRTFSLEGVWGEPARTLRDRLRELASPAERLGCLEGFLLERQPARRRNTMVDFALASFSRIPSPSSVSEVARSTGWSERRLSQVFREEVGFPPAVWRRIQRFQQAVRRLHSGQTPRWPELALDCGFYDQSHFANEFKAFSGIDATTYSANRTPWANHIPAD